MATNLKGPYFLTQAVAAWMIRQRESAGAAHRAIINIGSISATVASVNRGEYCLSKAGVAMATRLWAARLAEFGIGVYEVRPGIIESEMTEGVRPKYDALIESGLTIEKRWGTAADVASAVSVLARGELPYATGATDRGRRRTDAAAVVDGGRSDRAAREISARAAMAVRRGVGNPGMDSRCLFLFHPYFSSRCAGRALWREQGRDRLVHHCHSDHASAGRAGVGRAGRSLRTPRPADCLRAVLFHRFGDDAVRAELPGIFDFARALRRGHGRLLGHRRVAGDREFAERVGADCSAASCRLDIPRDICWLRRLCPVIVPRFGWQWVFLGGLLLAAPIVLLACAGAGAGSLAQQSACGFWRCGARDVGAQRRVCVPGRADDGDYLLLARVAGSLP